MASTVNNTGGYASEQNEMNAESLMMNFIIMQIPQKLRDKMVPVMNRKCPSFRVTEKILSDAFDVVTNEIWTHKDKNVGVYNIDIDQAEHFNDIPNKNSDE